MGDIGSWEAPGTRIPRGEGSSCLGPAEDTLCGCGPGRHPKPPVATEEGEQECTEEKGSEHRTPPRGAAGGTPDRLPRGPAPERCPQL